MDRDPNDQDLFPEVPHRREGGRSPDIQYPGQHDVMLGRGGESNYHSGNLKFRQFIKQYKDEYRAAPRHKKPEIAMQVVRAWTNLEPPGRFLTRTHPHQPDSRWRDVDDATAQKRALKNLGELNSKPRSRCHKRPVPDSDTKELEEANTSSILWLPEAATRSKQKSNPGLAALHGPPTASSHIVSTGNSSTEETATKVGLASEGLSEQVVQQLQQNHMQNMVVFQAATAPMDPELQASAWRQTQNGSLGPTQAATFGGLQQQVAIQAATAAMGSVLPGVAAFSPMPGVAAFSPTQVISSGLTQDVTFNPTHAAQVRQPELQAVALNPTQGASLDPTQTAPFSGTQAALLQQQLVLRAATDAAPLSGTQAAAGLQAQHRKSGDLNWNWLPTAATFSDIFNSSESERGSGDSGEKAAGPGGGQGGAHGPMLGRSRDRGGSR